MLDMISFWIIYGVLMVAWFSFPLYWSFNFVDKWLENITDGDMKYYLQDKVRNPLLDKLGLMKKNPFKNYLEFEVNSWSGLIVTTLSVIGGFMALLVTLIIMAKNLEGKSLHTFTVKLSEFVSEHLSLPILIIFCLVMLNGFLKKLYKFGKKAKTAIDKLEDK